MDTDINTIIDKIFTVEDAEVVKKLLEVVNENISESNKQKRVNKIDGILRSGIE